MFYVPPSLLVLALAATLQPSFAQQGEPAKPGEAEATREPAVETAGPADEAAKPAKKPEPGPELNYVLGARVHWQPEYAGSNRYSAGLTPIWAFQWGRWHFSASGGTTLLGFGKEVRGDGASTDLIRDSRFRLGVSLRIDTGRDSSKADTTAGLDDVKRTLRGRVYASYSITPDWLLSGALSQDLLGHEGGLIGVADLGWRLRQSPRSEFTAGVGLTAGNARYMGSYFGISPAASDRTGLPVYTPGTGLRDFHAGVGWTRQLSDHWIVFSGAGGNYLLGPAAASPLTEKRFGGQFSVGLAYRD
ncbi:MipA/OmpV family protein [Roseateles violae]|uniref:MipA/OmpV family protein n=1 Tax=Roseateles violae TaxID=3058042 RepID=A0ABT8DUD4_9BURK|nr:MipA/OmpV family protein [Pelomonas sp. PFR6]MDN3921618.1 MipA/OmpV family protein [Pelomonas sp. PFR6]